MTPMADRLDVADKWREGPYDLVVLSGPTLAREIAPAP